MPVAVRAEHRDAAALLQRQHLPLVLQQHDALAGRLQRVPRVLVRVDQIHTQREEVRVGLRIEEPELHLQSRQPEQGLVQVGFGDLPRLDRGRELRQV